MSRFLLHATGRTRLLSLFGRAEELKRSVYTRNEARQKALCYCNTLTADAASHDACESVLRAGDMMKASSPASWSVPPAGEVKDALSSPGGIHFHILCVDSM
ncbi:hypothetical protein EYF80_050127 [Liparis tanakae]|uniref:Uncharacterized protein n=1 Tax=Liparis tanakae TaxID=230148 RepID=A0A4Z2FFK2_9TELE|nr:hypothetical protein EYF80_050127 [Liparis tanakae]